MRETNDKPRCPKCQRVNVRHRVSTDDFICNICGKVFNQPEKK